jgi:hypothetical protein
MTFKAPRRPHQLARAGTQLAHSRRSRRHLPTRRRSAPGPLTARWTKGPDGRLSLEWTLERLSHHSINRKRGSDARLRRRSKS